MRWWPASGPGRWTPAYAFVWIDALTQKVREGGRTVNVHALIATGVNADGKREILGLDVATAEDGAGWLAFLRGLAARGLSGVQLVTSDCHHGLRDAIAAVLPGASLAKVPAHYYPELGYPRAQVRAAMGICLVRTIFEQPDAASVRAQHAQVVTALEAKFPKAASHLDEARDDILAFTAFPREIWRQVWSNNPQERLNKETRPADEFQHRFIAHQRLARPVVTNQAEHPMFDRVPLRGSWRVVHDRDDQFELIRQSLQSHFPSPLAVAVGPTAIGLDQQPLRARVVVAADLEPPAADRGDGKGRCVVRRPDDHVARVPTDVVNPVGDPWPDRPTREVVVPHIAALPPPAASRILKVTHPLFLLAINADHRQSPGHVPPPHERQVTKLAVTLRVVGPCQALAVGAQRELLIVQHAGDRAMSTRKPLLAQGVAQLANRFVRPLQPGHRVTRDGVTQEILERIHEARTFFFPTSSSLHRVVGFVGRRRHRVWSIPGARAESCCDLIPKSGRSE